MKNVIFCKKEMRKTSVGEGGRELECKTFSSRFHNIQQNRIKIKSMYPLGCIEEGSTEQRTKRHRL